MSRFNPPADGSFWYTIRYSMLFRAVAVALVVAVFVVSCGRDASVARLTQSLSYDTLKSGQRVRQSAAESFASLVERVAATYEAADSSETRQNWKDRADRGLEALSRNVASVQADLLDDELKLKRLGAVEGAERAAAVRSRLTKRWRQTRSLVTSSRPQQAGRAAQAIRRLTDPVDPAPLASDLGIGPRQPVQTEGLLDSSVSPGYNAPASAVAQDPLPTTPVPADLAMQAETALTPALQRRAAKLGRDPVSAFYFVRNTIRYKPYVGIRQGADGTLLAGSGGAADQAALLVALLRESGTPARFVSGVVELPLDRAANLLGLSAAAGDSPRAAAEVLAAGGIPTTLVRVGGVPRAVRFQHTWVEAYLSQSAYRGADEHRGSRTWIPLDPAIKKMDVSVPDPALRTALESAQGQAGQAIAQAVAPQGNRVLGPSQASLRPVLDELVQSGGEAVRQTLGTTPELREVLKVATIRTVKPQYLPAALPARVVGTAAEWHAVPTGLIARVGLEVRSATGTPEGDEDSLRLELPAYALAGRRVTLSYTPASPEDAQVIDAFGGIFNTPGYAAQLKPVLSVDGEVRAEGSVKAGIGGTQTLALQYFDPGFGVERVDNPVVAGSLSALVVVAGDQPIDPLTLRARQLASAGPSVTRENVLDEGRTGELLSILGGTYFVRNDQFNRTAQAAAGVTATRSLSGAITATGLRVASVAGFPVSVRLAGFTMDVDADVQSVAGTGVSGADGAERGYFRLSGAHASSSEAAVFSEGLGSEGTSTQTVFAEAAEAGIPLVGIDASNVDRIDEIVEAPDTVRRDIATAVADRDAAAVVPERPVPAASGADAGCRAIGYTIEANGQTQYRIYGGLSGGCTSVPESVPGSPPDARDALDNLADLLGSGLKDLTNRLADAAEDMAALAIEVFQCLSLKGDGDDFAEQSTQLVIEYLLLSTALVALTMSAPTGTGPQRLVNEEVKATATVFALRADAERRFMLLSVLTLAIAEGVRECLDVDDDESGEPEAP